MPEVSLVHFDRARQELALASSVDEVKTIRDQAEALRAYLKQQNASLEMQNHCAEIKLRAERRMGEMLLERDNAQGRRTDLVTSCDEVSLPPTLADLGISRMQSSRWQLEASLPEEMFESHVADIKAADEELTSAGLLRLAARWEKQEAIKQVSRMEQALGEARKYRCVVIDPPWPIQKIERDARPMQGQNLDYAIMTIEEIAGVPVLEQADPDGCHFYLWVTHKFLPAGLQLFERWGIRYQCVMTWVKPVGFTPFSWMYSTEHVLFGRIGSLDLLRMGLRLDFTGKVREHSRKPDEFFDLVAQASPGPRLEMFARQAREGFDAWGNEVGRFEGTI